MACLQVASFALALRGLLGGWGEQQTTPAGCKVVDFGCGSGNLVLPLAALFPKCSFVGVDMKEHAIALLKQRVHEAGLTNVQVVYAPLSLHSDDCFSCCLCFALPCRNASNSCNH